MTCIIWAISYRLYDSCGIKYVYYTVITSEFSECFTKMTFAVCSGRISMAYSADLVLVTGLWSMLVDEVSIIWEVGV